MSYHRVKYLRKNGKIYGPYFYDEKCVWDPQEKRPRTIHLKAKKDIPEKQGDTLPFNPLRKSTEDAKEREKRFVHQLFERWYSPQYRRRWK